MDILGSLAQALAAVNRFLDSPKVERVARIIFFATVALSTILSAVAFRAALQVSAHEKEGRQIVRQALCGVASGIITAGRSTIEQGGRAYPEPYESNLRRLNLVPPLADRALASRLAAEAYSRGIAEQAQKTSGREDLVNPDGTLNCRNLNKVVTP